VKAYRNGLMGDKAHLNTEGFAEIVRIKKGKGGMIKGRQMSTIATTPTILPRMTRFLYVSPISNLSQRPPEYPLIILFILIGAILLMSSSDLISMFLAIELQSYGLYIFATLHRDSE
jgi:NADH:ubiquinone oxidoreductase subunit 2 (subunit N)